MHRGIAFALVALLLMPLTARAAGAATFSLVADPSRVAVGERFSVAIWVNPNGEELDTVRAYLSFSSDQAQVRDMTIGTLFPRVSPGNGYDNELGTVSIGAFVVGSTVDDRGLLATVVFEAIAAGTADVRVESSSRLIANGEEKADASGHVGTSIVATSTAVAVPSEVSSEASLEADVTPPNPIVPYTPRLRYVEGEDALVEFGTTDDGSGMDHYELSVSDGEFFVASSPYVLTDLDTGDVFIEVKAVDRAGNERYGKTGIRVYPEGTELEPEDVAAREREQERIQEIRSGDSVVPGNGLLITFASAILAILAIMGTVLYRRRQRVS